MTEVSSKFLIEKGSMEQTKSFNDKAGDDAWAKMEDVTGATERVAKGDEKPKAWERGRIQRR